MDVSSYVFLQIVVFLKKGYGLADHSKTVELIEKNGYADYKVTFNNEGY